METKSVGCVYYVQKMKTISIICRLRQQEHHHHHHPGDPDPWILLAHCLNKTEWLPVLSTTRLGRDGGAEEEEDEDGASLPHLGFPRHHRHFVMMMTAARDVSQWSCIERHTEWEMTKEEEQ